MFFASLLYFLSNAWMLKWNQVVWRMIKLIAVTAGSISLVMTVIGVERSMKSAFYAVSQRMAPFHLSDLRIEIVKDMIKNCENADGDSARKDACSSLNDIDISARNAMFDKKPHVKLIENWRKNPIVAGLLPKYERMAGDANLYFDIMNREYDVIDQETVDKTFILALIVLLISVSASIGEAAYQYRVAERDALDRATAK